MPASAWSPFRHRAFAVLWSASLVSNVGGWMHDLAAGWLMTTLAPSAISGGRVSADGDARHTLPTTVARLRTWMEAKSVQARARPA